jgi:pheromone shutdown protein TraB
MTDYQTLYGESEDPRLHDRYVRQLPATGDRGAVVLVGAIHDHPASRFRAATVVSRVAPAVVALELSPLAIPLYRQYATEATGEGDAESTAGLAAGGDAGGGEMTAAIRAAGDARVVGIDAPTPAFLRAFADRVRGPDVPADVALAAARDGLDITTHALACRTAAALRSHTPFRPSVETAIEHESTATDSAAAQASNEAAQASRSRALLDAFETPAGRELLDDVREQSMSARLRELRAEGPVVAIVGYAHLEPLHERLLMTTTGNREEK